MIDLHTHTRYSDGTDTLEELLINAEKAGLEILSITDHDAVGAYFELEENPSLRKLYSGKIIVGCEMKTFYKGVPIEVLAYCFDYKKLRIHKSDIDKIQEETLISYKKICDDLGLKYDPEELYIDKNNPAKQWASFSLSTELLKHEENKEKIKEIGDFTSTTFYRVHQCNVDSPFYIDETKYAIDLEETIEEMLKTTELDGLECIYPLFSEEETQMAFDLCKKYNKYASGGSDYHAKNKPTISLGVGENNIIVDKTVIENWDNIKMI